MTTPAEIQSLADEIARQFSPEKIILFGSHAYGTPNENSDVDLLIVMEFEGRGRDFRSRIHRALGYRVPLDIVVRSPADAERRYNEYDPLIRSAIDKGRVLYERQRVGMGVES
jgi:predicted nucleotidyltransferase